MAEGSVHERFNLLLGGGLVLAGVTLGLDGHDPFWWGAAGAIWPAPCW